MPVEKAYLIPLLPLIAFTINILLGKHVKHKAALISIAASLGSCAVAWPLIWQVSQGATLRHEFAFLALGSHPLNFGILIDPPAATLLLVVTLIGTLIQIYSSGYMHDEPRFSRFFAYLSLFMAAMLMLVIANNYLQFFMSWEVMGLCSYLLIGFYSEKDSAANASKKAFLTTRIGDVGFFLGILALFSAIGTLDFTHMHEAVHANASSTLLPAAALLIFCGTVGKSAQFPLHVWLPDAMEGPTPVSALIHAATMVAAGVFLVARVYPLMSGSPESTPTATTALQVVTWVGAITAVFAATIAVAQTDIKRILAYSTVSQLGFMMMGLGVGGVAVGMFHLITHAFFKALLFMGAGSVIHGC
ncbi:MAG TPA: NADH-quinone oxidoreductase subunit L, partial [Verrucomicrobiae bacterium]|nr:NADH-quinone oxidoreductase subunit L [Verrucomicrobiae bacterium]